ncbi:MAG: hypothetical protein NTY80_05390 [candidate division SR1 bacterium]|nr:hypothetical protein [candidate division SR1 bacterium]
MTLIPTEQADNTTNTETLDLATKTTQAIHQSLQDSTDKEFKKSLSSMNDEELMQEFNKQSDKASANTKNTFAIYDEFSKRGISYFTVMNKRLENLGKNNLE